MVRLPTLDRAGIAAANYRFCGWLPANKFILSYLFSKDVKILTRQKPVKNGFALVSLPMGIEAPITQYAPICSWNNSEISLINALRLFKMRIVCIPLEIG